MSLQIGDVNPVLRNFEKGLDDVLTPATGNYFMYPSPDCADRACPNRQYLGHIVVGAGYEASKGSVGKEFRSGKLEVSLTRHAEGCGKLVIASMLRKTEVAQKLAEGVVRVQTRESELLLTRSSVMGLPLEIIERCQDLTALWLPEGGLDETGSIAKRLNYPNDSAQVDIFLQRMQKEIALGLQDNL